MADTSSSQQPLNQGPLGQQTDYPATYTPSLLHSMNRDMARARAGVTAVQQLRGEDVWTGYEFSWLNTEGKPVVAALRLRIPCQSGAIVESKSLKLYLGSFAQTRFESLADVQRTLDQDITLAFRSPVILELLELVSLNVPPGEIAGICLDDLDIRTDVYARDARLLRCDDSDLTVNETLFTHLFRSLCPVTAQPDWASVSIEYSGTPINRAALLKYLISYRTHQAFHETTIEQIYCDIKEACKPERLSVYGRFQRRGGLDINPFRSDHSDTAPAWRTPRQ
jgi:7-cyano-7-deazaguanine reductase